MAKNLVTKGTAQAGAFSGLGGQALDKFFIGTAAVDPASVTNATKGTFTITVTGAKSGDLVVLNPPSALEAGLLFVGAYCEADDTITGVLYNPTGAPVDGASRTWSYLVISKA